MYDLIVVGGGTAGCAAAYAAKKAGLKTLVIEQSGALGGMLSVGQVLPMMWGGADSDFLMALRKAAKKYGANLTYADSNPNWFNPELLKIVLDDLLFGVDVAFNTTVFEAKTAKNNVLSLRAIHRGLSMCFESKYFVDATGDGNFSILCGEKNLAKKSEKQKTSLRFFMSNINCQKFANWLLKFDKDRNASTAAKIDGQWHFSTAYTIQEDKQWALAPFFKLAIEAKVLKPSDCEYFQIFTIPNMPTSVSFNCPRISKYDTFDPIENSKLFSEGRKRIFRIANFVKNYLPGFENATITNISNVLGVRASRRIECRKIKTLKNIKQIDNNPILTSSYQIDIHSNAKNPGRKPFLAPYTICVEHLKAKKNKNLFVAGKIASTDFKIQSALRIQPNCIAMGEAVVQEVCKLLLKNA